MCSDAFWNGFDFSRQHSVLPMQQCRRQLGYIEHSETVADNSYSAFRDPKEPENPRRH